MSGQWPPDWGDPDDVDADAGQATAEADARQVTAFLAEQPDPVMPDAVEARISAAIAAVAADRAEADEVSGRRITARALGRPPRRAKVRRSRDRQPRKFGLQAITAVAACLVIAGFGFLLTRLGGSSAASSSAAAAPAAVPAGSTAHAEVVPENGRASSGLAEPAPSAVASPSASPVTFTVIAIGDVYQKSTLASQVQARIDEFGTMEGFSGGGRAPSSALAGCVLHLTGDTQPRLVDQATYAGTPVYVIAVPSRAWVVGRGCTATDPELITTVSLAGLRGNLSVLGSVEG